MYMFIYSTRNWHLFKLSKCLEVIVAAGLNYFELFKFDILFILIVQPRYLWMVAG